MDEDLGKGSGHSKKEAEQKAAKAALEKIAQ
jgi:dsRNA-specific ribonuclease